VHLPGDSQDLPYHEQAHRANEFIALEQIARGETFILQLIESMRQQP
jgi:hypothetical protein